MHGYLGFTIRKNKLKHRMTMHGQGASSHRRQLDVLF